MPAGQPFTQLCRQLARPASAGRADLHMHTTASDGTYTPAEIVDLARRSGLAAIAITDHDTMASVGPARRAASEIAADVRPEIIGGVEITAEFRGQELHLLGLFVRPDDAALGEALAGLRQHRRERFGAMVERLREMGITLADEAGHDTATLGRRHLAEMLVKARRAGNVREAFQRYLGDRGRVTVPKRCLPVAEAIALVRGAGGVAAWAHPNYDCTRETLLELRGLGMGAVEADFPSGRPSRRGELRRLARECGLAVTGGSDCHGPGQPSHALGACGISADELEKLRSASAGVLGGTLTPTLQNQHA